MTIKSRSGLFNPGTGIGSAWVSGVPQPDSIFNQNGEANIATSQVTEGAEHGWDPSRPSSGDVGGYFKTAKREFYGSNSSLSTWRRSGTTTRAYNGPISCQPGNWPLSSYGDVGSSATHLSAGATAIARSIPTAPAADVSVMLGEIFREGIPRAIGASMLKNRFRDYRDIGGEYLNYQFGWAPIVSDLKKVAHAVTESERILSQLERDSGRNVRRRYKFPPVFNTAQTVGTGRPYPALNSVYYYGDQTLTQLHQFEQKRWFSGCFTYHFERSGKSRDKMSDAAKSARVLLGLELTPSTVWNLSPWSWLADWVTNAGDVLSNVSRFSQDGLVMRYGYLMEHTIQTRSLTYSGGGYFTASGYKSPMPTTTGRFVVETKLRVPATPFGFGLDTGGFDPRQWAILGALGISKGPTNL